MCGEYTQKHNRKAINDFVEDAYFAYFKVMLCDENKS